jgi:tape measure domain-containing protein
MNLADLFFNINLRGGSETLNTINRLGTQFKNLGKNLQGMGKIVTGVGAGLTAGLTVPILGLVAAGVKYNMTMEDLQSNFKVLLGSEEEAIKMTAKLKKMGAETPFEVTGLADATKTLLNFGITQEKVIPIMSKLGDVSLGNKERFKALNLVMGQVSANGKLQGQDLLQFINAGWSPLEQIIERTGETMEEVRDRMSKGKVSVKEVEQALEDATSKGGRFYKGMEEGSKTLSGRLSTLKDNFMELLGNATKPLFDFLSEKVVPIITSLVEKFNGLSGPVKTAVSIFALLVAAMGPLTLIFGGFIILVGGVITAFGTIITLITTLVSGLGLLLIPITLLGGAFVLLTGIMAGIGIWYLIDKFGSLKGIFEALQIFIQTSLVPAFQFLASGEGLGKVSENAIITRDRLQLLRSKMIEIKNFIVETLVPALQYLATGEGIEKVKVKSGNLRTELIQLREKFVAIRDYINDTLIPVLRYLVTGDKGSLNSVKGMSSDTKSSIKDLRKSIEDLIKKVKDFDSSKMVKELGKIINKISSIIDSINNARKSIGNFFSWAKEKANGIKSFIEGIYNPLENWVEGGEKPNIKGFAEGIINNPVGRFAWVGEKGPEIMYIPKHTDIYSNNKSKEMLNNDKMFRLMNKNKSTNEINSINMLGDIIIDAKNIKEINDVIEVFKGIKSFKNRI